MKKSMLGLIGGNGELSLSDHVNSFASMKISGQSRETWMKNAGICKTVGTPVRRYGSRLIMGVGRKERRCLYLPPSEDQVRLIDLRDQILVGL